MTNGLWNVVDVLAADWIAVGLRGALLLAAAGVATLLLRRAPAALRHLTWLGASVGLLLLPLAGVVAPRWSVELPSWSGSDGVVTSVAARTGGPNSELGAPADGIHMGARTRNSTGAPAAAQTDPPIPAAMDASARSRSPEPSVVVEQATGPERITLLLLVWAAGTVTLLASLARSLLAVRRLERSARPFPAGRVTREAVRLGEEIGLRRPVAVLRGATDVMPLSWGIRRGRILLPAGADGWPAERLRSVLLHELAHVQRRDCLTQMIAEVARALHWPDPLAWVAVWRMRVEREHACDDRVLAAGSAASTYASELLSLARDFRTGSPVARAAVAMAGASNLQSRVRAVLDEGRRRTCSRARAGAVAVLAAAGTLALAGAAPADPDPSSATAAASSSVDVASERAPVAPRPALDAEQAPAGPDRIPPSGGRATGTPAPGAAALQETTCGMAPDGWNSHSHHVQNEDHRLQWSRRGCSVDVRVEGEVEFTPDFRDVARMGRGARLRIEEEEGRSERVLEITPGADGRPRYAYEVDGDSRDFDAAARAWYEGMLLQVFRKGGFMARERVEALLASGGPQAVLDELENITSDHVYARYVEELLQQASLDDAAALALVERAAVRVDSDHYLAGILEVLADRDPLSDRVLGGLLEATETLDSDHYRSGILSRALQRGDLTREHRTALLRSAGAMDSDHYAAGILEGLGRRYALEPELRADYLRAVSSIDSDHYRASVLSALLHRNDLDAGEVAVVLRAAGDMGSDHYVQAVLEQVEAMGMDSPALREAYFEVAAGIDSDHYRSAALRALLRDDASSTDLLLRLIEAVGSMDSDHYKAGLLVDIAGRYRLEGRTRDAYIRAMDSIGSQHGRGQAAEALLRQEGSGSGSDG